MDTFEWSSMEKYAFCCQTLLLVRLIVAWEVTQSFNPGMFCLNRLIHIFFILNSLILIF